MDILNPSTYMRTDCVGFEKVHYRDHALRSETTGFFFNPSGQMERETQFELRVQNGAGNTLWIRDVNVEYPENVQVSWTKCGYG